MTLFISENGDTGLTRQEKEMTEQNDDALIGTRLPNQHKKEPLLNIKRHRKSTAQVAKRTKPAKPIYLNLTPNMQKAASSIDQPMTDQEELNNEDHHDYGQ